MTKQTDRECPELDKVDKRKYKQTRLAGWLGGREHRRPGSVDELLFYTVHCCRRFGVQ